MMESTRFAILLDGPVTDTAALRARLADRRIVAADGGVRHARALGLTVEAWVGDEDSADPADLAHFPELSRHDHPQAKAASDGELALQLAMDLGGTDILLCGLAGGPRSDHVLFNMGLLLRAHAPGHRHVEADNGTERHLVLTQGDAGGVMIEAGATFSIFGFTDLQGLTVSGARWPLDQVDVPFGSTRTLSNVSVNKTEISLCHGFALVIVQSGE